MKLTKVMRAEFVEKVMHATKWNSKWNAQAIADEMKRRAIESEPADVKAFFKKYPEKVMMNTQSIPWVEFQYINNEGWKRWFNQSFSCIYGFDQSKINCEDLRKEWAAYRKESDARNEMRKRLTEAAAGATTLKDLQLLFPKLTKYMPSEPEKVKKLLPVAREGLYEDLVKLGFPKGGDK